MDIPHCSIWFNTRFVSNNKLVLEKREIDKAVKDTKHQIFKENLRVKLEFESLDEKKIQDINISTDFEIMSSLISQHNNKSHAKAFSLKGKDGKIKDADYDEKEDVNVEEAQAVPPGKQSSSNVQLSPQKSTKKSVFIR